MNYRSREEIVKSILTSAMGKEGVTRTQIMYNSLVSYTQLACYLENLIEDDLLEYNYVNRLYKITKKGLAYSELYLDLIDMLSIPNTVKR